MIKHFLYDFFYVGDQLDFAFIHNRIVILIVHGIMASPCSTRRARYTGQNKSICMRLAYITTECVLVSVQYRHRRLLFWRCQVFGGQRLLDATITSKAGKPGGGSFKNIKTIVMFLFLFLTLFLRHSSFLPFFPSFLPSFLLSICLLFLSFVCLSIYLSLPIYT